MAEFTLDTPAQRRLARVAAANAALPKGFHIAWEPLTVYCKPAQRPYVLSGPTGRVGAYGSIEAAVAKAKGASQ